ncbi:hypothetical protein HDV05_001939 [Chytridiales sp. JEL 0842]|nr:hypothetical protein HDV05_001939 [Chytridiales sp. JEL 0842]
MVTPNSLLEIPFCLKLPESDSQSDIVRTSVRVANILPAPYCIRGRTGTNTTHNPSYSSVEAKTTYLLIAELYQPSTFFSFSFSNDPYLSASTSVPLNDWVVHDPRQMPLLLVPEAKKWRSPPNDTPVEYDVEISKTTIGPRDKFRLTYRLALNPDVVARGVRLKKVSLTLREHRNIGTHGPFVWSGRGVVRSSVDVVRWDVDESPQGLREYRIRLMEQSRNVGSSSTETIAKKTPLQLEDYESNSGDEDSDWDDLSSNGDDVDRPSASNGGRGVGYGKMSNSFSTYRQSSYPNLTVMEQHLYDHHHHHLPSTHNLFLDGSTSSQDDPDRDGIYVENSVCLTLPNRNPASTALPPSYKLPHRTSSISSTSTSPTTTSFFSSNKPTTHTPTTQPLTHPNIPTSTYLCNYATSSARPIPDPTLLFRTTPEGLPAHVDIRHSLQLKIEFSHPLTQKEVEPIVLECWCTVTSINQEKCEEILRKRVEEELVPGVDYDKMFGNDVWVPGYEAVDSFLGSEVGEGEEEGKELPDVPTEEEEEGWMGTPPGSPSLEMIENLEGLSVSDAPALLADASAVSRELPAPPSALSGTTRELPAPPSAFSGTLRELPSPPHGSPYQHPLESITRTTPEPHLHALKTDLLPRTPSSDTPSSSGGPSTLRGTPTLSSSPVSPLVLPTPLDSHSDGSDIARIA